MQSRLLVVLGLALVACTTDLAGSEARTWTDTTGKYKTEAEFVDLKDGKVQLKTADGSLKLVPLEKLSEPDKEYVQRRATDRGSKIIKVVVREIYNCDGVHVPGTSIYIKRLSDATLRPQVVRVVQPFFASVGWKVAESEEEESDGTLTVQIHGWQERSSFGPYVVVGGARDGEIRSGGTGYAYKLGGTISLLGHRQKFGDSGRSTVRRTSPGKKLKGEMERRRKAAEHEVFSRFFSEFERCNFVERLSYVVSRAAGVGQGPLLLRLMAAGGELGRQAREVFAVRGFPDEEFLCALKDERGSVRTLAVKLMTRNDKDSWRRSPKVVEANDAWRRSPKVVEALVHVSTEDYYPPCRDAALIALFGGPEQVRMSNDARAMAAKKLGVDQQMSNDALAMAAKKLKEMEDPEAVKHLITILSDKDRHFGSRAAVVALGETGDSRAIEPLVDHILQYRSFQAEASQALIMIDASKAVRTILAKVRLCWDRESFAGTHLAHPEDRRAEQLLSLMGRPAVEALREFLEGQYGDASIREIAEKALTRIESDGRRSE
jgi:SLA1 Homology Domain 1 (SHD1) protein/HEAT repeat protein